MAEDGRAVAYGTENGSVRLWRYVNGSNNAGVLLRIKFVRNLIKFALMGCRSIGGVEL